MACFAGGGLNRAWWVWVHTTLPVLFFQLRHPPGFLLCCPADVFLTVAVHKTILHTYNIKYHTSVPLFSIPQGDVIYLHEPLLWTLRQHATNGVSGPDSLARAIGAVAPPLLEITARVGELGRRSVHVYVL